MRASDNESSVHRLRMKIDSLMYGWQGMEKDSGESLFLLEPTSTEAMRDPQGAEICKQDLWSSRV